MFMRLAIFLYLFFGPLSTIWAQKNYRDLERLANTYYEKKEFDKANVYFESLYEYNPETWYPQYFKSLMGAHDFDRAEKITKKQIRQNKTNAQLYVYLGGVYNAVGDEKKEKDAYDKALKELQPYPPNVQNLALAFAEQKKYDLAIQTYNRGRKATPEYPYFYERAEVYKTTGNTLAMIGEYLDALEFRDSEIQTVQMHLQNSLGYDDEQGGMNNPLLKQELQKRIEANPDKIILTEFLIFIQKQQKDFDGAFVQSRALDKRLKEEGQRIYDLARLCTNNRQWETARRCYTYLLEKGPSGVYFDLATLEGLNVDYLVLTQVARPQAAELKQLEQRLEAAYAKYKDKRINQQLLKDLASLKAYYLNNAPGAIALLEEFVAAQPLDAVQKAEYKLMLGDIYLIKGDLWDASLLYSQVEKEFKYEAIGQEAKFKNAKMSFYAGEFAWAKSQANILKGATSKLTANDALELSLIISDAIGVDSTQEEALRMYAGADLMVAQHRYAEADARLDSINKLFGNNTLGDDIYYKKAQIYLAQERYTDAETMYKNILEYYATDLYGDDAQFKLAELYELKLNDKEKAAKAYQDVMVNYPGSIFAVEARKRYRNLRGDNLSN